MELKSSKTDNKMVALDIRSLYNLEQKYKYAKEQYEEEKKKLSARIKTYMFVNGVGSLRVHDKITDDNISVQSVNPKAIAWDADKLEKTIGRRECGAFVEKQYSITDMEGLVKYLQACGVDPAKFKKYIHVEKKVNQAKFNEWSELNEVDASELKDCYELKDISGYLRISCNKSEG